MSIVTYQYPRYSSIAHNWHGSTYPEFWTCYDSLSATQSDYKYVFKVYAATSTLNVSTLIGTSKNVPRILENVGVFNPTPIINSLVKSTFQPTISTWTTCPDSIQQYRVEVQAYYNGETQPLVYQWGGGNGNLSKQLIFKQNTENFTYASYINNDPKTYMLTQRVSDVNVRSLDYATLRFLNGYHGDGISSSSSKIYKIRIDFYNSAGTKTECILYDTNPYHYSLTSVYLGQYPNTSSDPLSNIQKHLLEVGVGPRNWAYTNIQIMRVVDINGNQIVFPTPYPTILGWQVLSTMLPVYYDVFGIDSTGAQVSSKYRYNLICDQIKPQIQLQWENLVGGIDCFLFEGYNLKTNTINKSQFVKNRYQQGHCNNAPTLNKNKFVGYNIYDRGNTQIYNQQTETYTINSKFLTDQQILDLESLWQSNMVYAYINNIFYPVTLNVDSIKIQSQEIGLRSVTFDIEVSNKKLNIN